ncbi:flexible cuticle protein 12-like [Condylostylus longicornis]|uniref:flexible cuticle protein 12-like n=1 Tax=Condylostylus longicornis TaxID=2530218 RepID=UPI00244E4290|nr:flexible cuticle protein 12-like [Condylostylus longicornis]
MKYAIVFAALFAVALAAPLDDPANAQVLRYDNDNIGVDGYNFAVETSDGKSHQESGKVKNLGPDDTPITVTGSFRYTGDDGQVYEVTYTADENGFQPSGAHIPQA